MNCNLTGILWRSWEGGVNGDSLKKSIQKSNLSAMWSAQKNYKLGDVREEEKQHKFGAALDCLEASEEDVGDNEN